MNAENSVISPGGSVIYCEEAMKHYKEIGTVVYLKASYQTIKKRIRNPQKRGVVLREGQSLRDLYNERVPYFEKYADITVCEDGCRIEETIENVINAVSEYRCSGPKNKKIILQTGFLWYNEPEYGCSVPSFLRKTGSRCIRV